MRFWALFCLVPVFFWGVSEAGENQVNVYVDAGFHVAEGDSSAATAEGLGTRVSVGYDIRDIFEFGFVARQGADNRSVQDLGVFARYSFADRDSVDQVLYAKGSLTGLYRDLQGDELNRWDPKIELAAGVELRLSDWLANYYEADAKYLFDAEQIVEFAFTGGLVAFIY